MDDLDSLDLVALGHEIEESAGVALEQDDVRGLTTLGELADLVGERMDRPKP